jgi:hypothetical protein
MDLAQRILREDQFREDIHCMLMRTHAALGKSRGRQRAVRSVAGALAERTRR